jgi:hypothetical protein
MEEILREKQGIPRFGESKELVYAGISDPVIIKTLAEHAELCCF